MSFKIYSHSNGNLLSEHLFYVAKVMHERALIDKELAFLFGICHDFGKLTSFFQKEKILQNGVRYKERSNHSLISIHFAIAFLEHYGIEESKIDLAAVMVINHHSDLRNMAELISSFSDRTDRELIPQIIDLQDRIDLVRQVYQKELPDLMKSYQVSQKVIDALKCFDFTTFLTEQNIKKSVKKLRRLRNRYAEEAMDTLFFHISYLYALLIYADRNMAAKLPYAYEDYRKRREYNVPSDLFANKVKSFHTSKSDIRQRLFDTLDEQIETITDSEHIFTITAPTGAGKTLAALNFALKLKSKFNKKKIVYALPLTNIIEQNYQVIKEILSEYMPDELKSHEFFYLLKHHYLADYRLEEHKDVKEVLQTVESWNAQFVVTTFIQLFYAFGSNHASYLYRFSALQDAVLILDEPQVLKPEQWLLIRKMLLWIVEHFGIKLVLMTATKPLIFQQTEYLELARSIDFKAFIHQRGCRHKLVPAFEQSRTIAELAEFVTQKIRKKKSVLVVLNTKKSSIEFYRNIKEKQKEFLVYYLSTNLTPYHRKMAIKEIQKKIAEENSKVIVVSTQVIEAGVDLDFEIGFRDIAPIDSIIQTAGRVNRHFHRKEVEPLYVVRVRNSDHKKEFGAYIYDTEYLQFTKLLLNKEVPEADFEDVIQKYFEKVQQYNWLAAKNIAGIIDKLNYETLNEKFQIIEKSDYTVPVYLEINEDAKEVYETYIQKKAEIDNIEDYEKRYEARKVLQYMQRKLYEFIVNVDASNRATDDWLTVIDRYDLQDIYDYDEQTKMGTGIDEEKMNLFS